MDEQRMKVLLKMLGVDRPVVKTEQLSAGVVRVTLLGGDSFEVALDETGAPGVATVAQGAPELAKKRGKK